MVKRHLLTLAATAGFLLSLSAAPAMATPIRPDLQKLLAEPQEAAMQFVPARAGWQGPEMSPARAHVNPAAAVEQSSAAEAARASLLAAVIPDPRVLALIALTILLLRRLRKKQPA